MRNLFTRAILTIVLFISLILSGLASQYPANTLADRTVVTVQNLTNTANRPTAIAAIPGLLTEIEALTNATTMPVYELVGIRTYIGAFRSVDAATATRVDAALVQLAAIIASKSAQ